MTEDLYTEDADAPKKPAELHTPATKAEGLGASEYLPSPKAKKPKAEKAAAEDKEDPVRRALELAAGLHHTDNNQRLTDIRDAAKAALEHL